MQKKEPLISISGSIKLRVGARFDAYGLSATAWYKRENIPCSTFFYRERKVREFLVNDIRKDECCFEQLPVLPIPQTRDVKQAITISVNGLDINISNGTNEETIAAVLRAVKSAW